MSNVSKTVVLPLLLGLKEVARLLGLSYSHVRKFAHGVQPPPNFPPILQVGSRRVVRRDELFAWVADLKAPESESTSLPPACLAQANPSSVPARQRGRPRNSERRIGSRS